MGERKSSYLMDHYEDLWGLISPLLVLILDNFTVCGAVVLIIMQGAYQVYRFKVIRKENEVKNLEIRKLKKEMNETSR